MPGRSADEVDRFLRKGGDFLTPSSQRDVALMGMIEAQRGMEAGINRLASNVDDIKETLHDVDKRLAVIEQNSIERDVRANREKIADIDERVDRLEDAEQRRQGAIGLFEWFCRSWPALAVFGSVLAVLFGFGVIEP